MCRGGQTDLLMFHQCRTHYQMQLNMQSTHADLTQLNKFYVDCVTGTKLGERLTGTCSTWNRLQHLFNFAVSEN